MTAIANHMSAWAKSGGWVNPYQTADNALVAMWDGEWNDIGADGVPFHNTKATTWKDIISGSVTTGQNLTFDGTAGAWHNTNAQTYFPLSVAVQDAIESGNFSIEFAMCGGPTPYTSGLGLIGDEAGNYFSASLYYYKTSSASLNNFRRWAKILGNSNIDKTFSTKTEIDFVEFTDPVYAHFGFSAGNGVVNCVDWGSFSRTLTAGIPSAEISRLVTRYGRNRIFALRIYNRSMSEESFSANYAIDKARFNLPDAT